MEEILDGIYKELMCIFLPEWIQTKVFAKNSFTSRVIQQPPFCQRVASEVGKQVLLATSNCMYSPNFQPHRNRDGAYLS